MLDPSTFRYIFCKRTDGSAKKQRRPLGRPWPLFSRMRILAGGHILEGIDMYIRVHDMFVYAVLQIAERMITVMFSILGKPEW